MDQKQVDWQTVANEGAQSAHEKDFSTRWAVVSLNGALLYFNNNPYRDPTRRETDLSRLRNWMAGVGMRELAFASYPPPGEESAGYTCAMVIEAPVDAEDDVGEVVLSTINEIIMKGISESYGRNN